MTLPLDTARCFGFGAGPQGIGVADECLTCQRRTAPRAGARVWIAPTFPCTERIDPIPVIRSTPVRTMPEGSEPWDRAAGEAS